MLVVIFKEVEHIWLEISEILPVSCDAFSRLPKLDRETVVVYILVYNGPERIVQTGFVIQIVKSDFTYVFSVKVLLIYFSNEYDMWKFLFDPGYHPFEEFRRYKLHHVAPESVDAIPCPETYYFIHFFPSGSVHVAVIYLDGFIPVVGGR